MLTACSKMDDPQPTPDPAVQFTMTRTMTFATAPNHVNGVTHAQKKTVDSSGTLTDTGLKLWFSEQNALMR